jgi:hypothetical protein
MECSLFALIACFSWSNLYVDSGLLYQDGGEHYTTRHIASAVVVDGSNISQMNALSIRTANTARNPYGRLSLGYQIDFGSMSWRLEASHISSVATTTDRGINSVAISARWFPFRN